MVARRPGGPLHDLEADAALGVGGHVGRAFSFRGTRLDIVASFIVLFLGKVDLAATAKPAVFKGKLQISVKKFL